MPAKTQDVETMILTTGNMYEVVLVIAKRARQINEEMYQKKRDRQILEELEGGFDEDFMQVDPEEIDLTDSQLDEDNPVVYAEDDFKESRLHYTMGPK